MFRDVLAHTSLWAALNAPVVYGELAPVVARLGATARTTFAGVMFLLACAMIILRAASFRTMTVDEYEREFGIDRDRPRSTLSTAFLVLGLLSLGVASLGCVPASTNELDENLLAPRLMQALLVNGALFVVWGWRRTWDLPAVRVVDGGVWPRERRRSE